MPAETSGGKCRVTTLNRVVSKLLSRSGQVVDVDDVAFSAYRYTDYADTPERFAVKVGDALLDERLSLRVELRAAVRRPQGIATEMVGPFPLAVHVEKCKAKQMSSSSSSDSSAGNDLKRNRDDSSDVDDSSSSDDDASLDPIDDSVRPR